MKRVIAFVIGLLLSTLAAATEYDVNLTVATSAGMSFDSTALKFIANPAYVNSYTFQLQTFPVPRGSSGAKWVTVTSVTIKGPLDSSGNCTGSCATVATLTNTSLGFPANGHMPALTVNNYTGTVAASSFTSNSAYEAEVVGTAYCNTADGGTGNGWDCPASSTTPIIVPLRWFTSGY